MGSKINLCDKRPTGIPVGFVIRDTDGKHYVWDGMTWILTSKGGNHKKNSEVDEDNFDRAMDGI